MILRLALAVAFVVAAALVAVLDGLIFAAIVLSIGGLVVSLVGLAQEGRFTRSS